MTRDAFALTTTRPPASGECPIAATNPAIFSNFIVSAYYWTSTTDAANPAHAWTAYSCDFGIYNIVKTDARYSLAVR